MTTIVNAAPQTISQGTQDLSTRQQVPEQEALPTHLPKIYVYTKKGPTTPQLVVGESRTQMYDADSFDPRLKWANHATELSNIINAAGNAQMLQRIKPADAAPPASIRLSLDVLPMAIPKYQRNADGSFKLDEDGFPEQDGNLTVNGFRCKWVASAVTQPAGVDSFGQATQGPGDQTDGENQSLRYPIADIRVSSFGSYGNDLGLRLWAPTLKSSTPLDDRLLTSRKVYPFRMACVGRADSNSTARVIETLYAEQFINVCLKPDVIDPNTSALVYAGDVFLDSYRDLSTPGQPLRYGSFNEFKLYDANIKSLLEDFYAAEQPIANTFSDFTGADGEEYLFNIFSGQSSQGVPYHSFQLVAGSTGSFKPNEGVSIFATGGTDGTMNDTAFAAAVADEVALYADRNSYLQDDAKYPESIIYDSGFPVDTKEALVDFIAVRKDTFVVLGTHVVGGPDLTASQESSLALALKTRLQMYPESDFYGTPVMRGMIVGRSGKLLTSQFRKHLPLTLEIARKAATYMGASNGKWKPGYSFDKWPNNQVTSFGDVNVTFTPSSVRNKDWANGLNWVDSFERRSLYFPALKTVYEDDTSVLNSFFTAMVCVEVQKVGKRVHRRFSGVSSLTNNQLIERVNEEVINQTTGRFDDRVTIVPKAYFTKSDEARGYSWTLPIQVYAAGMKTVMTLNVETHRIEELETV